MHIQVKIALFTCGILVLVTIILSGQSLFLLQRNFREMTHDNLRAATIMVETIFNDKIHALASDANLIAQKASVESPADLPGFFRRTRESYPDFLAFTLFDRHGVIDAWGDIIAPAHGLQSSPYLRRAFQGATTISTTRVNEVSGTLVCYVSAPMPGDRVLTMTVDGMVFQQLVENMRFWDSGQAFLLDGEGTILASIDPRDTLGRYNIHAANHADPRLKSLGATAADIIGRGSIDREGFFEHRHGQAEDLFTLRELADGANGWVAGIIMPFNNSPVAKARKILFRASAIFLGMGFAAAFLLSGYIAKPFILINERNRELLRLNEQITSISDGRIEFLANMTHELRTPLNVIIGLAELSLGEDDDARPERTENLEQILKAGASLLGIVNDILDISKINSSKFEIIPAKYDLPSLIHDVSVQSMVQKGEKPIEIELNIDPDTPALLYGDDLRIRQMLGNLLNNAFKYTHAGRVTLGVSGQRGKEDDVWMRFVVADTGIGIRAEHMEKLFSNYYQADSKANRKITGTGLGLALVKQISELMEGGVTVESEYGRGSVFTVRIRQKRVGDTRIGREIAENLANFDYASHKIQRARNRLHVPGRPGAKVLVVDDVPANLIVAKGMLKPYGMRIDCAGGGQAAIDLIRAAKVKYDAVFMDHMMPGIDGMEVVRIIRNEIGSEYARTVPIIALTANAVAGNEKMFLENGFQAFLPKPVDGEQLDLVVRRWVKGGDSPEHPDDRPDAADAGAAAAAVPPRPEADRRINADGKTSIPSAWSAGVIDGLNPPVALARFGGDMEMYLEVAAAYVRHTPALLEKIRSVTPETLADYAIIVHGLKSGNRNIGADVAGDLAEAMEKAAKAGDIALVRSRNPLLLETMEKLLAALSDKLKSGPNRKPQRDEPDPETLEALRRACVAFDIDRMDQAMRALTGCEYPRGTPGAELVAWLEEKAFQLDFKGIAARLAEKNPA